MPSPIPQDNEHRLHVAITVAAAVLAVAMIAAAVWAITRPRPGGTIQTQITPAEETSAAPSGAATSSAVTTAPPSAVATPGASQSQAASASAEPTPTPGSPVRYRLAYHQGGNFYVATDDARSAALVHVVGTSYAVSPDGRSVAAIDGGKLLVTPIGQHTTANSPIEPGLSAENISPVWMPDSSAVFFVRQGSDGSPSIWRYTVGSGATARVVGGSAVAVSPDGHTLAAMPTGDSSAIVIWSDSGKARSLSIAEGDPVAVALGNDRIYVSTVSSAGDSDIWSLKLDGTDKKRLAHMSATDSMSGTFGELMLSPDGSKLLYAADGDDGYSRLSVVSTSGGMPVKISGRRDGYALRWSPNGKRIYFIEGNAYQGQTTGLYWISPNGRNRTLLVAGAGQ